jgi:hypothetical protein
MLGAGSGSSKACTSSELLSHTDVGREAGVSAGVVRVYFFDMDVANYLARRSPVPGSADFGKSFGHMVLMEL